MERAELQKIKELYGNNFIGPEELKPFLIILGGNNIEIPIPNIDYSLDILKKYSKDYILILGTSNINGSPLTIEYLRSSFGIESNIHKPCFYNQDWYLKEDFINRTLASQWYLLRKEPLNETRAKQPEEILKRKIKFPSAVLCTYTFFAYYFLNKEYLWYHDFIWCEDKDHNGDRIYVGKYNDIDGINKNGFSIHRHLALRKCYSAICIE